MEDNIAAVILRQTLEELRVSANGLPLKDTQEFHDAIDAFEKALEEVNRKYLHKEESGHG